MERGKITRVVTDYHDFNMTDEMYQFAINSDNISNTANVVTLPDTGEKFNMDKMVIKSRNMSISGFIFGTDRTDALNKASELKSKLTGARATIYDEHGKTMIGYFSNFNHGFYRGKHEGRVASINSSFIPLIPYWLGEKKTIIKTVIAGSDTSIDIVNTGNAQTPFKIKVAGLEEGMLSKNFLSDFFVFQDDSFIDAVNETLTLDSRNTICKTFSENLIPKVSDGFFLDPFVLCVGASSLLIKDPGVKANVMIEFTERFV